jgi:plastocyanin
VPARSDIVDRTLPRLARGLAVLALGLGGLTACGGGSDSGGSASTTSSAAATSTEASQSSGDGQSQAKSLTATETNFKIAFDSTDLTAGTYDIKVVNSGSATHNLTVEEDGTVKAHTDNLAPGDTATLTVDLDAGEYVFYCSIDNHRAMGMELTAQVK